MRRKRVLLIEPHEDSRNICSTMLRHFGYDVMEARDGETGVELAHLHAPDLIVMDIVLPVVDGWATVEVLRRGPQTAGIPIIALTTRGLREDQLRGEQFGIAAYLVKPCSPRNVLVEVHRVIGVAAPVEA